MKKRWGQWAFEAKIKLAVFKNFKRKGEKMALETKRL